MIQLLNGRLRGSKGIYKAEKLKLKAEKLKLKAESLKYKVRKFRFVETVDLLNFQAKIDV